MLYLRLAVPVSTEAIIKTQKQKLWITVGLKCDEEPNSVELFMMSVFGQLNDDPGPWAGRSQQLYLNLFAEKEVDETEPK